MESHESTSKLLRQKYKFRFEDSIRWRPCDRKDERWLRPSIYYKRHPEYANKILGRYEKHLYQIHHMTGFRKRRGISHRFTLHTLALQHLRCFPCIVVQSYDDQFMLMSTYNDCMFIQDFYDKDSLISACEDLYRDITMGRPWVFDNITLPSGIELSQLADDVCRCLGLKPYITYTGEFKLTGPFMMYGGQTSMLMNTLIAIHDGQS